MPEPGQPVLKPSDQDDRGHENGDVPRPRKAPLPATLGERDGAAYYGQQTQVFDRQENQIRMVVNLTQSLDFTLQVSIFERGTHRTNSHRAVSSWLIPI